MDPEGPFTYSHEPATETKRKETKTNFLGLFLKLILIVISHYSTVLKVVLIFQTMSEFALRSINLLILYVISGVA